MRNQVILWPHIKEQKVHNDTHQLRQWRSQDFILGGGAVICEGRSDRARASGASEGGGCGRGGEGVGGGVPLPR